MPAFVKLAGVSCSCDVNLRSGFVIRRRSAKLKESFLAEWRNWQTHQTQNLAKFTLREGSTPSSATTFVLNNLRQIARFWRAIAATLIYNGLRVYMALKHGWTRRSDTVLI
jgi:hypothetical protein